MSVRSRLQRLEQATTGKPESWYVASEEAAAELREQAKREGRPAPSCLVVDDPLADPPFRVNFRHEQALSFLWNPETAEALSYDQLRELVIRARFAPRDVSAGFFAWMDSLGEGQRASP